MTTTKMDTLNDRYFVRLGKSTEIHDLPLASKRTLLRILIQFLIGDYHSVQIFREDYMDKKVFDKERIDGVLIRGEGLSMRTKFTNKQRYDKFATQFREGLYDPEESGAYKGETMTIPPLTDEQFESAVELLTLVNQGDL